MKKRIQIKQHDITDCGAACLASIAAYYQLRLPIARIRQYASTNKRGTNVLGLIEAANKMGFIAKGVKGTLESLQKIPKPAIAHVVLGKEQLQHFVVIYEVNQSHIKVMDPGEGKLKKMTLEAFQKEWSGVLLLLQPQEDFQKSNEKVSVFRRFWFLIFPHKTVLIQALVGALVYTLIGLTTSIYVQKIVDNVIPEGNANLLNLLSVVMLLLLGIQILIGVMKSIFALKVGQQIDTRLILGYYKHLLKLPQTFFDQMRVGEITSRLGDAFKIRLFINDVSLNLAVNLMVILFSFALMFTYYWKLALVILIIIPLYAGVYALLNVFNKRTQRKLMEDGAKLESQLVESLNSIATIKRFGLEEHTNLKTETRFIQLLRTVYKSGLNSFFSTFSTEFLSRVFTIILLWVGAGYVLQNEITPGELLSFYALIGYFTSPASSLIQANTAIQDALIAADRLFEIIDLEQEEEKNTLKLEAEMVGDIRFENVYFRYGSRTQVFQGLNLNIPKGKITAVMGESGSGKTTLLSLLQNLYPLQSGNIYIGEYDLKHLQKDSLRQLVSVVPQKIDLFAGTVLENIALGDYTPDIQRVLGLSQQLGIIEFIEKMPNGFQAMLGEQGVNLSGGQRQRLAIARALYRNPEILILDEATSALDSRSENFVHQTMQSLKDIGKTVIVIAHRFSSIQMADKIIVLDNGKAVEEGNHVELMQHKKQYYQLWKAQHPHLNGHLETA